MSYIDSNLIGNEEVLYRGKVTLLALIPWIIWGLILAPFTVGFGLLLIPLGYLVLRSSEAGITNKRLIAKAGLIKRDTVEIPIKKYQAFRLSKGFLVVSLVMDPWLSVILAQHMHQYGLLRTQCVSASVSLRFRKPLKQHS